MHKNFCKKKVISVGDMKWNILVSRLLETYINRELKNSVDVRALNIAFQRHYTVVILLNVYH